MTRCEVCSHNCRLSEGQMGMCLGRKCKGGRIIAANYGHITSIALDPIEKKPLNLFYPGSKIISVGSYGCNLRCPFCQNHEISYGFSYDFVRKDNQEDKRTQDEVETFPEYRFKDSEYRFKDSEYRLKDPEYRFKDPEYRFKDSEYGLKDPEYRFENPEYRFIDPEELAEIAKEYIPQGNIGVAFTYNEPLVGYEYVVDAAKEVHKAGLKTVLVSNGNVSLPVCHEVSEHIDAMNIDLKGFTDDYYSKILGGSRKMVMDFIAAAAKECHMEVTTLIVPGFNDSEEEMDKLSHWISELKEGDGAKTIALHISRYFPRFRMLDVPATDVDLIYRLSDVARQNLEHVFVGNC